MYNTAAQSESSPDLSADGCTGYPIPDPPCQGEPKYLGHAQLATRRRKNCDGVKDGDTRTVIPHRYLNVPYCFPSRLSLSRRPHVNLLVIFTRLRQHLLPQYPNELSSADPLVRPIFHQQRLRPQSQAGLAVFPDQVQRGHDDAAAAFGFVIP